MTQQDANLFFADATIKIMPKRLPYDLQDSINLIRQNINTQDLNAEEKREAAVLLQTDQAIVIKFMLDEDYIKPINGSNQYRLTKLGRKNKDSGGIFEFKRQQHAITVQIETKNARDRLNQILLERGAIGAAVGAILLVAWEIFVFFYEHHC